MNSEVVFLLDADNTLLDGDRFVHELHQHLDRNLGSTHAKRYWSIFDRLRSDLGYVDYLGALQLCREAFADGSPAEQRLLLMSEFLLDYPFAQRLYPRALEVIERLSRFGLTVILSDGDVVLQPRKIVRSGLWDAVEARVLVYVHKEQMLNTVQSRFPAKRYFIVDDKLGILAAVKSAWSERVTTVFARQGHYALDAKNLSGIAPADMVVDRIGDLADLDWPNILARPGRSAPARQETA